MYTITACYEGGYIEVFRVREEDVDMAVAELEDQPDWVSIGIKPDSEED